jgi:hypothetical protein
VSEASKPLKGEVIPAQRERGRPTRLDAALIVAISNLIRAGAYPYVAAEACGLDRRTYYRYMQEGYAVGDGDPDLFDQFREAVRQAQAEARATAEIRVKLDKPDVWLMRGPGRERGGAPGWATAASVELTGKGGGPVRVQGEHVVEHFDADAPAALAKPDLSQLDDRELAEFERMLRKMLPGGEVPEP